MHKRVLVRDGAVTIPLDGAEISTHSECGCIVGMTEDTVAVHSSGNYLQLLDIRAFCSGSTAVRHVIELPQNVAFPPRVFRGQQGVVWETIQEQDQQLSIAVYCVDFHAGELHTNPSLILNEQIVDSFVDATGKQVAVVGATTGRLWGRSPLDQARKGQTDWRLVDLPALDAQQATQNCNIGRFVSSAVMGNCFVYLRSTRTSNSCVLMEKWIFDVDSCWTVINFSSRTLQTTEKLSSTEIPTLYIADSWKYAVLAVGKTLYRFNVDEDLRHTTVKSMPLEHRVLDGAWIDRDTAFALLLTNGQISVACINDTRHFDLMTIATSSTRSKRLSLSALMGRVVSAAFRLVWVAEERQVLVDFGTACAAFSVGLVDEEDSRPDDASTDFVDVAINRGSVSCNRRVIPGRIGETADIDDYARNCLEGASLPSSNELLDIARIALARNFGTFEDLYFMLLRMIHQQLASDFIQNRDPIDCISESLKVMEVFVSFTISMEAAMLRQISSRMLAVLPGCTTTLDRKVYYVKEIRVLSQHAGRQLSKAKESEDWWVGSMEANVFLQVYFARICALLQDVSSEWGQRSVDLWRPYLSLCQQIIDQEDFVATAAAITTGYQSHTQLERLGLMMTSYLMLCYCLRTNGILINLEHLVTILAHPAKLKRKETLCCFAQPWYHQVSGRTSRSATSQIIATAVQYADKARSLKLLIDFCLASGSFNAHACIQDLCKMVKSGAHFTPMEEIKVRAKNTKEVDDLHLQTCETYIGEVIAILQRLGPLRQFRFSPREAGSSTGRLTQPFCTNHEFNVYREQLLVAADKTRKDNENGSQTSSLWIFSRLDERLRARVIYLLSRIIWHVETVSVDICNLAQRAFEMELFAEQLDISSAKGNEVSDFISKAREVVMPANTEIRFTKCQRSTQHTRENLPFRLEKIVRSLVMAAWALWLREKVAHCRRRIHVENAEEETRPVQGTSISPQDSELEGIGVLAAVCALHLNSLCIVYGEKEDISLIQLSLLEKAAAINASKTAAIVAWGFPVDKVQARYLKRYKALRQVITKQGALTSLRLEENEKQYQRLQKQGKQGIIQSKRVPCLGNAESTIADIEVLVNCCCDHEFQLLISALTKVSWELMPINTIVVDGDASQQETRQHEPEILAHLTLTTEIPPKAQLSENLISRDEVMALLQAQTQQIEEKIKSVTTTTNREDYKQQPRVSASNGRDLKQSVLLSFGDIKQDKQYRSEKLKMQRHVAEGRDASPVKVTRKALHVLDVNHHRQTSAASEADTEKNVTKGKSLNPAVRHDSVRNALKLFRLRQENGGHTHRNLNGSNRGHEIGLPPANDNANRWPGKETDTERIHIKAKHPVSTPSKKNRRQRPSKEPIYPLHLEYGTESASLKLLGRDCHRNPSVQRRQFVNLDSDTLNQSQAVSTKAFFTADSVEVIQLKSVSAQTNDTADISPAPKVQVPDEQLSPQNDSGPEKYSPAVQKKGMPGAHVDGFEVARRSQQGIAIQCQMNEDSRGKVSRRRLAPPSLNIADKYPIWVDLDGVVTGNRFKERKKFIQVAQFAVSDTAKFGLRTANNDLMDDTHLFNVPFSTSTMVVSRKLPSDNDSEGNQSDGQHSPTVHRALELEDHSTDQSKTILKDKYRASYRQHYPARENPTRASDDRETASGIETLLGLRDDMQQMTQRLRALETCANSIDEEFKASQKRLNQIGDKRLEGDTFTKISVVEDIDKVLAITEVADADEEQSQANGRKPTTSILSKKASSDLDTAKKLLETIEQLTIAE